MLCADSQITEIMQRYSEEELLAQIDNLRCEIGCLQQANNDLQIRLLTTTEHGDLIEAELQTTNQQLNIEVEERKLAQATLQSILEIAIRDRHDLEIILSTTAEHGDVVEYELYNQAVEFLRQREEALEQSEAYLKEQVEQQTTQLHKMVEALQRSNSLLQAQIEAAIDGILAVDEQGYIVSYNQRFCQMWNVHESLLDSELDSEKSLRLLGLLIQKQKLPPQLETLIENTFDCPDEPCRGEIHLEDGKVLDWYSSPVISPNRRFYGLIWSFRDISDRIKIQLDLQAEKEKSEQLLLNIFPASIAERLKQNQSLLASSNDRSRNDKKRHFIAESFAEATVLFADIVGFTAMSNNISPTELVGILNRIFSIFDNLAEKHGLEKIKTIGDGYMVVGGLPTPKLNHAQAIADMALDMKEEISRFKTRENRIVTLRIGINTGSVVAGVIGTKKFTYDLWGNTVNVASRMESQGQEGEIQVTESTYLKLQNQYLFAKRGAIAVKGKGKMNTYWLLGKK